MDPAESWCEERKLGLVVMCVGRGGRGGIFVRRFVGGWGKCVLTRGIGGCQEGGHEIDKGDLPSALGNV